MKRIFLLMFYMIFLMGIVSAVEWNDRLIYSNNDLKVSLNNWWGLGETIGTLELKSHRTVNQIRNVEIGNPVVMWYDSNFSELYLNGLGEVIFTDLNTGKIVEKNYNFVYWGDEVYYDPIYNEVCNTLGNNTKICSIVETSQEEKTRKDWMDYNSNDIPKGEIKIGIRTNVAPLEKLDAIWTIAGKKISKHAVVVGTWQFTDNNESAVDSIIYTWPSVNLSVADSNRVIVVGTGGRKSAPNADVTTISINGHNATRAVDGHEGGSGAELWYAVVPNSTSGDIIVNWNDTQLRSGIGVWALYTFNETPHDTARYSLTNGTAHVDVLENGVVIGYAYVGSGTGTTWTGATENFDDITESAQTSTGAFNNTFVNTVLNYGVTINRTLVGNDIMVLASWGIGGEVLPNVTLNSPINAFNSTSQIINFNGTVVADIGIVNVSLFIDGVLNETNSSGVNDTDYLFTKTLSEGNHNWTYEACNSNGCTTETTRNFTIDSSPTINVVNPPFNNSNFTTSTIFFNATNSLPVDTWIVNYNGTNVTLTDINTSLEVEDGIFQLLLFANNSVTGVFGLNDTIFFSVDSNIPFVNITQPFIIVDLGVAGGNFTFNATSTDGNLDICWYDYNFTNTTYTCNTAINVTLTDQINITAWANDTFGNENLSFSEWNYTIFENSQTFNSVVFEGNVETFTANITVLASKTIATATLFYNGTGSSGSVSASGNDSILTINLTIIPVNADTNITFFWNVLLSDGQSINLTSNNQTITSINLDDCSVNTVVLYNYTVVDEGNQSILVPPSNVTTELNLNLFDIGRENSIANFTKLYTGINPFAVCLNLNFNETSYLVDSIVKYEAIAYSIEYYNIVGSTITNTTIPINITLFDLFTADATEFKITFKGEDFVVVEDALIFIDRQYISENNSFKTVELPKTDSNGQTVGHFVRNDIVYNIRVIKDNIVLGTFNNIIAFCQDFTIGDCQIVLEATPEAQETFNYNDELGILFQSIPTFNNVTNAITFSFSTTDGTPKTVFLLVERKDIFGNRSICNNTLTSASGTLSCTVPSIDDTVLETSIFVDNQLAILSNVELEGSDFGNMGFIAWFFLTFIFMFLFGNSKTEVLIGMFVSFAGAITLGITRGSIVGIGSAGIWVLVITILGIWKLNKENPQ